MSNLINGRAGSEHRVPTGSCFAALVRALANLAWSLGVIRG